MHLIDTTTIKLHEFIGSGIPDYAILSHRWGVSEVSFQDVQAGKADQMPAYSKVRKCCDQAALDGWQYVWIDSCCINKASSAELSEAINSMFRWYRDAQVCYAYLADVPAGQTNHFSKNSAFRGSKWFTRGWTLQELLAPSMVVFFDEAWNDIGTKSSLSDVISSVTGIESLKHWSLACAANIMCWASYRETTRVEDEAYSLIGLFGVNMPPLYGEGRNAFARLQVEILKNSDDESIFAWTRDHNESGGHLADSPADFRKSGNICRQMVDRDRPPYLMTNKGLSIELHLLPAEGIRGTSFLAPLNCARKEDARPLAMALRRVYRDEYIRVTHEDLVSLESTSADEVRKLPRKLVLVKQTPHPWLGGRAKYIKKYTFLIYYSSLYDEGFTISLQHISNKDSGYWLSTDPKFGEPSLVLETNGPSARIYALILFTNKRSSEEDFLVVVSMDSMEEGVDLLTPNHGEVFETFVQSMKSHSEKLYDRCKERISGRLLSGRSVSLALRKGIVSGMRLYKVDVTLHESGELPWPAQS